MSYILGLDLGETSLGIAVLNEKEGEPISIDSMGVRIFPDGRENDGKTPLAVKRRIARGIRRNLDRRLKRKEKLIEFLIENNLISQNKEERLNLKKLNPYELRTKGLDEKLSLNELSRVLIHINQRRGFLNNRKSDKQQKDSSDMKVAMKETIEKIKNNGCKTLGEYLYFLQKQNSHSLLRVRPEEVKEEKIIKEKSKLINVTKYNYFPSRELYFNETKLILDKQSEFYPQLNNIIFDKDLKKEISIKDKIVDIIFYQRKLRPQEVGKCQFEDGEYRCPKASPLFQEFRILCNLVNLDLINEFHLTEDGKKEIKNMLMSQKEVKFSAMRKKLNIGANILFNLESDERENLEGDVTSYELSKKDNFGKLWKEINEDKKEEIVDKILNEESDEKLTKYLKDNFNYLSEEQINNITNINLPDGYASLSLKAIRKIIIHLREGKRYDEACEIVYGSHSFKNNNLNLDKLPYYGEILKTHVIGGTTDKNDKDNPEKYFGKITNPTVHIGLNQLKYCVNKIIEEKGKPEYIVIELARDLKLNKKQKSRIKTEQDQNIKDNKRINEELKNLGLAQNYDNRMLYKIWERLAINPNERRCPFCGTPISISNLFSPNFHIEHLLPFSKTYDDSINNKVIACSSCNSEKRDRSPFEAWGHDKDKYNEIMARVEFLPKKVQWRFEKNAMEKFNDENKILARMLSDTQYLSKVACEYLSCLYPNDNKKHIRTIPGQLTEKLRYHWGLNKLISGDDDIKDRTDHRHHAIDAFVVACTNQSTMNKISKASGRRYITKTDRLIENLEPPFDNFNLQNIQRVVDNVIISYKEDHKWLKQAKAKNGTIAQLHNDTYYGLIEDIDRQKGVFATRKPFIDLDKDLIMKNPEKDNKYIADNKIRKDLQELVKDVSDKQEVKKIIESYSKTAMARKDGTPIVIKTIRIHEVKPYKSLMSVKDKKTDKPYKYAETNGNYCAEIYIPNRGKNKDKWCVEIISNFNANAHKKDFVPNWRKEEPEAKLIMRLFINDMIEIEINDNNKDSAIKKLIPFTRNNKVIVKVKKMSNGIIYLRSHNVAKENKDGELTWQGTGSGLQIANAKKVRISPLGKIEYLKK